MAAAPEQLATVVADLKRFLLPLIVPRRWPNTCVARKSVSDGQADDPERREARALRQRETSDVIEQLLARIG